MKFKTPSLQYVKISLDRLTRFKTVNEKYSRVINDVLARYCFDIKVCNLNLSEKIELAAKILNSPFDKISDFKLNEIIKNDEKEIFYIKKQDEIFLNNKIDFQAALCAFKKEELPLNLYRLKVQGNLTSRQARQKFSTLYPVEKVVLVEGITEEILLCSFAKILGLDFKSRGVFVLGAGGKNQVARKYYRLIEEIKIPIFVLLDFDAGETCALIDKKLRKCDCLYKIKSGEFEDILPKNLIKNALNFHFAQNIITDENEFGEKGEAVNELNSCYKNNGWGAFKKADFAKIIREYIDTNENPPVSGELKYIIKLIGEM